METETDLLQTPLNDLHVRLGGKMVPFAGYSMPVQYPAGIMAEHNHTREKAGLFDVSHMGQAWLSGESFEAVADRLETLVPGDIKALAPGRIRYTQFTNEAGGIVDDLMVTRAHEGSPGQIYLVVNASRKHVDYPLLVEGLGAAAQLITIDDRALLAFQGPAANGVIAGFVEGIDDLAFMETRIASVAGIECWMSRSGYTGEDGFEISVAASEAEALASKLLEHEDVMPCGLGARDSLRLEAGLCLYGNDIDEETSPVEAGLIWSISKRRRAEGGFPGADRVQKEIADGASKKRVGIKPLGRAPARQGTEIADKDGTIIGSVTSGGFGPTVGGPVAMGYVPTDMAKAGSEVDLMVRGKAQPGEVVALPFVPNNFKR